MAARKEYAWYHEEDGEGGYIGTKADLDLFFSPAAMGGGDDDQERWLNGLRIVEIGQKFRAQIEVETRYHLEVTK